MSRRIKQMLQLAALGIAAIAPHAQGGMTTPGQFGVSPSGAATYSIPIQVPPGTGGIEPKLALNYNSQSGNGLLGIGWSLGGLSAISRCARTMAQDGVRGSINYDNNDRYCLDGQRLIALPNQADGGNGTEYRTELDGFAKIVSYGTAGNGPAWFKVWTKAGQVMEYGNTADSRIEAQGKTTVRVWALNRLQDSKGNYLTVGYSKDSGMYYPQTISYTGNNAKGITPTYSVQFYYEYRTDATSLYQAGSVINTPVRLKRVGTLNNGTPVSTYSLAYADITGVESSRLTSIQSCMPSGTCTPPVVFNWLNTARNGWQLSNTYPLPIHMAADGMGDLGTRLIDLNGDGLPDLVYSRYLSNSTLVSQAWLNTGNGWVQAPNYALPIHMAADGMGDLGTRLIDLNGDGLPDLVYSRYLSNSTLVSQAWLNTGNGWVQAPNYALPIHMAADGMGDLGTRLIDLNGDGLPDLVYSRYLSNSTLVSQAWLNTGSGWVQTPNYALPIHMAADRMGDLGTRLIDLNGDGLPDFVYARWSNGISIRQTWLNTGTGWLETPNYALPENMAADGMGDLGTRLIDLNGDGLPDLVYSRYLSNYTLVSQAWLNTGSGWIQTPNYALPVHMAADGMGDLGTRLVDLNGDGLPDLVYSRYLSNYTLVSQAWLNTGSGWIQTPNYALPVHMAADGMGDLGTRLIDLNGDGLPDLVYSRYLSNHTLVSQAWLNTGSKNFISSISDGIKSLAITYKLLTDKAGAYTKDPIPASSQYPKVDLQLPQYVVSSVTSTNGSGGTLTTSYQYGGLKAEVGTGRGLLGFRWMKSVQQESGISSYSEFRQDYPYTGLPSLAKKTIAGGGNNGLLNQINTDYGCLDPATGEACTVAPGHRYFPYAKVGTETSWDLDGSALPTIITAGQYDNWGNATQISVNSSDGYSKTTVNSYAPADTTNWYLGRLTKATVTSTAP